MCDGERVVSGDLSDRSRIERGPRSGQERKDVVEDAIDWRGAGGEAQDVTEFGLG